MTMKRKGIIAIVMTFVMALAVIVPINMGRVWAIDPTCTVAFGNGIVQGTAGNQTVTYKVGGTDVVARVTSPIDVDNNTATIPIGEGNVLNGITIGDTFNPETMSIKVSSVGEFSSELTWNKGANTLSKTSEGGFPNETLNFSIEAKGSGGGDEPGGEHVFDGSTTFVWIDENGVFRYHTFTGLHPSDQGFNYFPVATVTDDIDNSVVYSFSNQNRDFVYGDSWIKALSEIENGGLTGVAALTYLRENDYTIDPIGSESSPHSYLFNGNYEFSLYIYDEVYEGVTIGTTGGYVPEFLSNRAIVTTVDIGATSQSAPATFDAYLLNDTITLSADAVSTGIRNISPVGVPNKAVSVSEEDGIYSIKYNSNYYDNVVLAITDANNNTGYLQIRRKVCRLATPSAPTTNTYLEVYYPDSTSYSDYAVVVNTTNASGVTSSTVVTNASLDLEDYYGNKQNAYECNGGTDLKMAWYQLPIDVSSVASFSVNVIRAGDLTSSVYPGTYAGKGNGMTFVNNNGRFEQQF